VGLLLLYADPAPLEVSALHRVQSLQLPGDNVQRVVANRFDGIEKRRLYERFYKGPFGCGSELYDDCGCMQPQRSKENENHLGKF
jgi:hypothetical protein